MKLAEIVAYADAYLGVRSTPDYPGAWNGLQVENGGEVRRVLAAVDASQATIDAAVAQRADLVLVHHGLFWDGARDVTGRRYRRLKALLDADIALYSAHLPLDVHPEIGNNVALARALGVRLEGTFGTFQGMPVGVHGALDTDREALTAELTRILGAAPHVIPGGNGRIGRVGVVTGGAGSMIPEAAAAGLDAFITGEGAHHTHFDAMEAGLDVFYGGHYATETFGVRNLAEHLAGRFGLAWSFFDHPTGL